MNWKKIGTILAIVLLLTALSGCVESGRDSTQLTAEEYPLTIADNLGRNVTIFKQPERVVSLAPSNTEILFALGLGDKVLGVTEYCNYPLAAQEKEKVGGFSTVSIERVVALEPDLILAAGIHESIVGDLERLDLTVVVLDSKNVDDILENIILVGKITGQVGVAEELTASMEHRINAITSKVENAKRTEVFYVTWHDPLRTVGPGTNIHELIRLAGGSNIAGDARVDYPIYSLETLIERDPDVIIISSKHGAGGPTVENIGTLLQDRGISAVRNCRIYEIDADLVVRDGPRVVDGLEEMAKCIHPELFGVTDE
ncbi:MAG: cobalamin-binding protein [Methanosarcinales archaeon]|nr:MAG: cobalamin-binding protein [Methanosarcinales archaeon]